MNILVINAGSSSLKYQLINMDTEKVIAKGIAERIGAEGSLLKHTPFDRERIIIEQELPNHEVTMQLVLNTLLHPEYGVISGMDEINAVGHRVVHGGEKFSEPVIINDEVMAAIEECASLAPLHNRPNMLGIQACQKAMPGTPMVAVFDTAFHQTVPNYAYLYGIPYSDYKDFKVRRYGFHGTSHYYLSRRVAENIGRPVEELKTITCHLGNGASVAAIEYGKSIDTSMGLTPLEGLIMGTRCGDLDAGAAMYLMDRHNFDIMQLNDYLNKHCGVLGLSGLSSDFRDLEAAAKSGNEQAALVRYIFCYRIKKYIGSYAAIMNGVDAIVFSGGIGESNPDIRYNTVKDMSYLGIEIDPVPNETRGQEICISTPRSKVSVWVIPTDEEMTIAKETLNLIKDA
ncbi:MAG: acetate kinase [Clostridiales bacterium]|nr:acetate kinase [Clostridiales bacterium]